MRTSDAPGGERRNTRSLGVRRMHRAGATGGPPALPGIQRVILVLLVCITTRVRESRAFLSPGTTSTPHYHYHDAQNTGTVRGGWYVHRCGANRALHAKAQDKKFPASTPTPLPSLKTNLGFYFEDVVSEQRGGGPTAQQNATRSRRSPCVCVCVCVWRWWWNRCTKSIASPRRTRSG